MNLFILDEDLDRNAQAHIDLHVGKMQLEATQLLTTALWVDKYIGYVPRALNRDELDTIKAETRTARATPIDDRPFTRYLPTHHNHPCSIWARSSLDNYEWIISYVNALNTESQWRGNKPHASCAEANRLPSPENITRMGLTPFVQAMPDEYRNTNDAVDAYRHYYMGEKAIMAVWKRRGKPEWWDEMIADYKEGNDPHGSYLKTVEAKVNKGKPWSLMGVVNGAL